mmetsp:Transcript_131250/g.298856  ORF Transcript_131250/g.298856 Transcript_131250/m.298856 type:complete len:125 (+) Transcript_131250:3-377(+)
MSYTTAVRRVLRKLHAPLETHGNWRTIDKQVKQIYQKACEHAIVGSAKKGEMGLDQLRLNTKEKQQEGGLVFPVLQSATQQRNDRENTPRGSSGTGTPRTPREAAVLAGKSGSNQNVTAVVPVL